MRVPIPVVILLCSGVIGGVWWAGTRKQDFLSPPSEEQLALIREKAVDALPSTDLPPDADATAETATTAKTTHFPPKQQPQEQAPQLAEYRNQAVNDPALLLKLARQLESRENPQRSLLAWERLVDTAAPDESRTTEAIQAIRRLRPALPKWNADPAKAMAIILHAGTGKRSAGKLAPVLEGISRDFEQASSGILAISSSVKAGNDIPENSGPAPIALWISGPGAEAPSTEVLVFTNGPGESLRDQVLKNLFKVIRSYLSRTASISVPQEAEVDVDPFDAIQSRITRLGWLELGSRLNKTLE